MKLASVNAADSIVFEVDIPSQGMIFSDGLPLDARIKVDLVTTSANDVNRIPEMDISDLFDINIYIGVDKLRTVHSTNSEYQNSPLVLFSTSGVLLFDDDVKYKVSLSNLNGATFDIFNLDSSKLGVPMVVKKAELKLTQAERTENYGNIDLLLFNGAHSPTKLTYLVNDNVLIDGKRRVRKIEISAKQIEAYHESFELTGFDSDTGEYSNGITKLGFPIDQLDAITLHHDTALNEDMSYLTVDYR